MTKALPCLQRSWIGNCSRNTACACLPQRRQSQYQPASHFALSRTGVAALVVIAVLSAPQGAAQVAQRCPGFDPVFQTGCDAGTGQCDVVCPLDGLPIKLRCDTDTGYWMLADENPDGCMRSVCDACECKADPSAEGYTIVSCRELQGFTTASDFAAGLPLNVSRLRFYAAETQPFTSLYMSPSLLYHVPGASDVRARGFNMVTVMEGTRYTWARAAERRRAEAGKTDPMLAHSWFSISITDVALVRGLSQFFNAFARRDGCRDDMLQYLDLSGSMLDEPLDPMLLSAVDYVTIPNSNVDELVPPPLSDGAGDADSTSDTQSFCCLVQLTATNTPLRKLASLANCLGLTHLKLGNTNLTSVPGLPPHQQMEQVVLENNRIREIVAGNFEKAIALDTSFWDPRKTLFMKGNPTQCVLVWDGSFRSVFCTCHTGSSAVAACPAQTSTSCEDASGVLPLTDVCDSNTDCEDESDERWCGLSVSAGSTAQCVIAGQPWSVEACLKRLSLQALRGQLQLIPNTTDDQNCPSGSAVFGSPTTASGAFALSAFRLEFHPQGFTLELELVDNAPFSVSSSCTLRYLRDSAEANSTTTTTTTSTTTSTTHAPSTATASVVQPTSPSSTNPASSRCLTTTQDYEAANCSVSTVSYGSVCTLRCTRFPCAAPVPATCTAAGWSDDVCPDFEPCGGCGVLQSLSQAQATTCRPHEQWGSLCEISAARAKDVQFARCDGNTWVFARSASASDWAPDLQSGQSTSGSSSAAAVIGAVMGSLIFFALVLAGYFIFFKRRSPTAPASQMSLEMQRVQKRQQALERELQRGNVLLQHLGGSTGTVSLRIIPAAHLQLEEELGRGAFGVVHRAIWRTPSSIAPVAAKQLTATTEDVDAHAAFLVEAQLMNMLRHPALVQVLGLCTETPQPTLVMEYLAGGNLRRLLRERSGKGQRGGVSPQQFLEVCITIADGMAFLSKHNVVHRDLACRNILVGTSVEEVKISDYGMARFLSDSDYYRMSTEGSVPIRWMAPESLEEGVWTSASDVWSCAVTFWEAFSFAKTPFAHVHGVPSLLAAQVQMQQHLPRPEACPEQVYKVLLHCWACTPERRPTFDRLLAQLVDARPFAAAHPMGYEGSSATNVYQSLDGIDDEQQSHL